MIHEHPTSAERILTTALELFAVKGYDATAVREICEAAGITKPTLYHFYGSKDGVLRALLTSGFEGFRTVVDRGLAAPGSFRERLKIVARALFEGARQQPHFWRFIHNIMSAPPGSAPQCDCAQFHNGVLDGLTLAMEDAVASGDLAPGQTKVRMLILMGALGKAATGYVMTGRPELTPQLADELIDTILDGWHGNVERREPNVESQQSNVESR